MKKTIVILGFVLMVGAQAGTNPQPSETEMAKNQACFQDLEIQGCGKLEDDHVQFRACMSNAVDSMDDHCKKLMLELYGN